MIPADFHIHTNYSWDATGTVEQCCQVAQAKGIREICFTNHLNFGKFQKMKEIKITRDEIASIELEDIPRYYEEIEDARKKFDIKIRFGFEIDYFKVHESLIDNLLKQYPIDFVMGSPHFIDGYAVSAQRTFQKLFAGKTIIDLYKKYFERLNETIESRLFDIVAHPDIVTRYTFNYEKIPFERYRSLVEKAVELLVENNVGIEVNSSGYNYEINEASPSTNFLRVCKEKGLETVTIGSDAHEPARVGQHLERVVENLKQVGYSRISVFESRKRSFIDI